MNTNSKNRGLRILVLAAAAVVVFFAAVGFTGVAAQAAIPGDALYPVKTTIEQSRLSMAADAGDRSQIRMRLAEQRLKEIEALIQEGRYQEVRAAVLAFEASIHSAILDLETIAKVDPARGAQLALEITGALTRYAQTLSFMAVNAPQGVATEVNRALETTQIASGLEMPSAGLESDDNSNSNTNDNANLDGNDNTNLNGDDNANGNEDDDNINSNANLNSNGDEDNSNANLNSNGDDDNSNANCSDEAGNDDSSGDCSNENSSGSNSNGDEGSNGNSNDDSGNDNGDDSGGSGGNDNGGGDGGGGNDNGGDDNGGGGGGGGGNDNGSG